MISGRASERKVAWVIILHYDPLPEKSLIYCGTFCILSTLQFKIFANIPHNITDPKQNTILWPTSYFYFSWNDTSIVTNICVITFHATNKLVTFGIALIRWLQAWCIPIFFGADHSCAKSRENDTFDGKRCNQNRQRATADTFSCVHIHVTERLMLLIIFKHTITFMTVRI